MAGDARRYAFNPLERRGVILGLRTPQLVTLLLGGLAALAAARALRGGAGPAAAVCLLAAAGLAGLWPLRGQPLVDWLPVVVRWACRRAGGPAVHAAPLGGALLGSSEPLAGRRGPGSPRPGTQPDPHGVVLLAAPDEPGQPPLGLLHDRVSGTWAAVVPVAGRSFALLDPEDKARRLAAWGTVLAALSRAGSPLRRVQWVERCAPSDPSGLLAAIDHLPPAGGAEGRARASYRQLAAGAGPAAQARQVWLVLAVAGPRRPSAARARTVELLRREVRLLEGQLRTADLGAGRPLDVDGLAAVLDAAHRVGPPTPGAPRTSEGLRRRHPWAMATDEAWAAVRVDGNWHATYWIAEWPRLEVGPDFLTPLLSARGPRTVSVVMGPVAPDRALRQAAAARTANLADEELRRRAGFLPSARREREAAGATRREEELADGHAELRFSGYVTVSAPDRVALDRAAAALEHAAQAAHLDVRRLYGRQAEAFTWTLPLARGLA